MTTATRQPPNRTTVMPTRSSSAPGAGLTFVASELEALLGEYAGEYRSLAAMSAQHLRAIASADRAEIDRCTAAQQAAAARMAKLDSRRAAIERSAAVALGLTASRGGKPAQVTTSMIAAACPEPTRGRLQALAFQVRSLAEESSLAQRTVRAAAMTLASHMQSLMEQVGRALSHAGTYTRTLAPMYQPQVVSGLDLTT